MRLALLAAAALAASPAAVLTASPVAARMIGAGPGKEFDRPSLAIAAAQTGDTVLVEPGSYYDCATWTTNGITLAGRAPGVVLTDTACAGKAILVIAGNDTVVRDLTLARARVEDGNGAGIRLEGQSLLLERVQFVNNQVGILAAAGGPGTIKLTECRFEDGGISGEHPSVALFAGPVALLQVERSVFTGMKGSQIGSAALQNVLSGNQIATSRLAVSVAGGGLVMEDNVLELSPDNEGRQAAVLANGDLRPVLRRNQLVNRTGQPASLLLDWTTSTPLLEGNVVEPPDREVASDGMWRYRAGAVVREVRDGVRSAFRAARQKVLGR